MSEGTEESGGDGFMSASEYFRTPDEAMRYLFTTDLSLALLQSNLEVLSIKHRNSWDWIYKITASAPEDPPEEERFVSGFDADAPLVEPYTPNTTGG